SRTRATRARARVGGALTARYPHQAMAVAAPEPVSTNPLRRLAGDIVTERGFAGPLPPGPTSFSLPRTRAFALNPLPILLDASAADVMLEEAERATADWATGRRLDLYRFTRTLALRVAQRALFGFDPDASSRELDAAAEFERALGFYGRDYLLQILRGPRTPW